MKVMELVESIKNEGFDPEKELEIKKYIPVMEKKAFVMDVIAACTDDIDDFITVDRFNMDIYFDMNMIKMYTNLEITSGLDEMIEQYDVLCEHGLLSKIIELFENEYASTYSILEGQLEELLIQNSMEAQIVKITNKINNVIDMLGKIDINSLLPNGIDAETISNIAGMIK